MTEPDKYFISPDELRLGAVQLARQVYDNRFVPNRIIGLWRGGAPIGLYVHEALKVLGIRADYVPVITRGYKDGIDQKLARVAVLGTDALAGMTRKTDEVLVVDDVWDTGRSIDAFLSMFQVVTGENHPEKVRIGTVYFKPARNTTNKRPDYHVHTTEKWLVFPHEFGDCTSDEIERHMGGKIADLLRK
jgi:hypoxanthine phosphoribosyltransferase